MLSNAFWEILEWIYRVQLNFYWKEEGPRIGKCFLFLYVESLVRNQYLHPLNEFAIIAKYNILKISHLVMNRKEKIHYFDLKPFLNYNSSKSSNFYRKTKSVHLIWSIYNIEMEVQRLPELITWYLVISVELKVGYELRWSWKGYKNNWWFNLMQYI